MSLLTKSSKSMLVPFIVASVIGSALGQGVWANKVFCTSGAGSTALETGYFGTCTRALGEPRDLALHEQIHSGDGGCDPCFDIPAFQSQISQGTSFKGNPVHGCVFPLADGHATSPDGCRRYVPYPQRPDFPSPTLTPLRTTVLLI